MASSDRVINQQGTYYLQWKWESGFSPSGFCCNNHVLAAFSRVTVQCISLAAVTSLPLGALPAQQGTEHSLNRWEPQVLSA